MRAPAEAPDCCTRLLLSRPNDTDHSLDILEACFCRAKASLKLGVSACILSLTHKTILQHTLSIILYSLHRKQN